MDYNITNGGIIGKVQDEFIMSNIKNYYSIINDKRLDSMLWFINIENDSIYYSNQKADNYLCKMNIYELEENIILKQPCYGVVLHNEMLYYINEINNKVYRCQTNGKKETNIIDEEVNNFIINNELIYYTTSEGIWICDELGNENEKISEAQASMLVIIGEKLVYNDKNNKYNVTLLDMKTNSTKVIEDISSQSMNTDGKYLYCTNRLNNKSIYRIDPKQGNSIRICGESAEHLHIIDDKLFFSLEREWYNMPLIGGQFEKVLEVK
ncbi:MAG: DUF5050 domain-containing protein [Eubacteriales bacterium]